MCFMTGHSDLRTGDIALLVRRGTFVAAAGVEVEVFAQGRILLVHLHAEESRMSDAAFHDYLRVGCAFRARRRHPVAHR